MCRKGSKQDRQENVKLKQQEVTTDNKQALSEWILNQYLIYLLFQVRLMNPGHAWIQQSPA